MYIFRLSGKNSGEVIFMMVIDRIALVLVIIGALNWGSVGIFAFDFVSWLFGGDASALTRIVYTLVGLAGVWSISLLFRENPSEETTSVR
jgi:uncharacterized membrane protein YuzA (DUF378 family)